MAAAGDADEKKMMTHKSSGGEEFEVEEAVAMQSQTIPGQNVLEAVAMEPPPRGLLPRRRRSPTDQRSGDPSSRWRPSCKEDLALPGLLLASIPLRCDLVPPVLYRADCSVVVLYILSHFVLQKARAQMAALVSKCSSGTQTSEPSQSLAT
ncbi:hypothetical protein ZWY2020_040606 [Hordeum vulgare]|nr:hypothetical protein ZWY2020_040606 [Hordeum vulgare]